MSVVEAYHMFVCELFLMQGGMWTGQSTYLPASETIYTQLYDMLPQHS